MTPSAGLKGRTRPHAATADGRNTRRVLVTGGTRGIGAAIARLFAADGHEVIVSGTGAGPDRLDGCRYLACDFSDGQALQAFAERVAQMELSVLINNAGINKVGELAGYALEDFERIQQVNVAAPFVLCRAVVPGMRQRRYGRIVNITSIFGVVSRAGRGAYSASKAALGGLSRALALESAADNVLVNCLAPGFVETDLTRRVLGAAGMAEVVTRIPMGRLAQPEEIARYAKFLASEQNTYMTGQALVADGGFLCG